MAFDTRNKRGALLGLGLAILGILPIADGALVLEDATQIVGLYRCDFPAAVPTVTPASRIARMGAERRTAYFTAERRTAR
jgi:hypothetical protein